MARDHWNVACSCVSWRVRAPLVLEQGQQVQVQMRLEAGQQEAGEGCAAAARRLHGKATAATEWLRNELPPYCTE